jgi:hypothetical protein
VRACFGVDAFIGQAQPLDRPAAYQVLLHNLRGIGWLNVAIPDGFGINHHCRPVFALIQTKRLIDADCGCETGGLGQLLQLGEEFTLSIAGAGWAWGIGGALVMADKDMAFKRGQAVFLLVGLVDAADRCEKSTWLLPE